MTLENDHIIRLSQAGSSGYYRVMIVKTKNIIRSAYDWTLGLSGHRRAVWALAGVSFIESSVFPIPPDVMLIPMCLSRRDRAWFYAMVATLSSVAGGLLGYAIGYFLYETLGQQIISFYGAEAGFDALRHKYAEYGGLIIFAKGLTPFPYKVITILSGVLHLSLPVFIVASIFSRAIRFFLVAGLIWKYGAPIKVFIEKYLTLLCFLFLILLIAGFAALKYLL